MRGGKVCCTQATTGGWIRDAGCCTNAPRPRKRSAPSYRVAPAPMRAAWRMATPRARRRQPAQAPLRRGICINPCTAASACAGALAQPHGHAPQRQAAAQLPSARPKCRVSAPDRAGYRAVSRGPLRRVRIASSVGSSSRARGSALLGQRAAAAAEPLRNVPAQGPHPGQDAKSKGGVLAHAALPRTGWEPPPAACAPGDPVEE